MLEQVNLKNAKGEDSFMTLHDKLKTILIHLFPGYILSLI
jgi:hypothetical protein